MIELFYNERMRVQSDVRDMKLAQLISCLRKQSNILYTLYILKASMLVAYVVFTRKILHILAKSHINT